MSTVPSGQRIDPETLDFHALPADCFAAIISLTSPLDACRLSLVSPFFNSVASSDAVWVKFLPVDYQNLFPAPHSVSSLKDLYLNLCDHPVLIEDGKKSFSLDKRSGQKCYMLAARNLAITWGDTPRYWTWISRPNSRFPEVVKLLIDFRIIGATVRIGGTQVSKRIVYVIDSRDDVQNGEQYPKVRGDGWFEVELGEFFNGGELEKLEIYIFSFDGYSVGGLYVQGIDIRPS
ncbi:hypothetical protein SLA2020_033580 [Shorea laevis]